MKVILLVDDAKLGKKRDVIEVADSYARNVLIPKNIAIQATKDAMLKLEAQIAKQEREYQANLDAANLKKAELEKIGMIHMETKHANDGKLFGSITSKDIAEELAKINIDVKKQDISLSMPIKAVGVYPISIKLFTGITVDFKVSVQ